jgi:hypothetical protein
MSVAVHRCIDDSHASIRGDPPGQSTDMTIDVPPMPNQNAAQKQGTTEEHRKWLTHQKEQIAIIRAAPTVEAPAEAPPANEKAADKAAREAAREQERAHSQRLLDRAFWSLETCLHWIAFRNVDRLENDADAVIHAIRAARFYGAPIVESAPEERMLSALQSGDPIALKDGIEMKPGAWANCEDRTGRLQPMHPGVALRREDVLRLWPLAGAVKWLNPRLKASSKDQLSRKSLPPMQAMILEISARLWPDDSFPVRIKDRDERIREAWPRGQKAPDARTIRRAFAHRTK